MVDLSDPDHAAQLYVMQVPCVAAGSLPAIIIAMMISVGRNLPPPVRADPQPTRPPTTQASSALPA